MRKKGDFEVGFITPIIIVIVIVVSAILLYQFYLSPNASPNWFRNIVDKYKYGKEFVELNKIQEETNSVLSGCVDIKNAESIDVQKFKSEKTNQVNSIIADIENQIINLPERASSMLDRFTKLKAEAEANARFCAASIDFAKLKFDGKDENKFQQTLAAVRKEFEDVGGIAGFQAVVIAKERIALIDKIKKCDFKEKEKDKCTPGATNDYCAWIGKRSAIVGILATGQIPHSCAPTTCAKAKDVVDQKEYCKTIYTSTSEKPLCYLKNEEDCTESDCICDNCEHIKSCSDYGEIREQYDALRPPSSYPSFGSCINDVCKKGLDCKIVNFDDKTARSSFPAALKYVYLHSICANKGATDAEICLSFKSQDSCEVYGCLWAGGSCAPKLAG